MPNGAGIPGTARTARAEAARLDIVLEWQWGRTFHRAGRKDFAHCIGEFSRHWKAIGVDAGVVIQLCQCQPVGQNGLNVSLAMGDIDVQRIGESADTNSGELTFAGRVYIYCDDRLSSQQLADLENVFKSNKIAVSFRGGDYLVLHWNEKRPKSPTTAPS